MLRWLGDLGFYVDQWYSVYAVLFFCFGLHLEAEPGLQNCSFGILSQRSYC